MEEIIIIGAIPYLYIYSVHFVCMYDRDSCMHGQMETSEVTHAGTPAAGHNSLIAKNLCFIKDSSQ